MRKKNRDCSRGWTTFIDQDVFTLFVVMGVIALMGMRGCQGDYSGPTVPPMDVGIPLHLGPATF